MPLTPSLYHRFVRPRRFTEKYIHSHIRHRFQLERKFVLDFGSGTGANCVLTEPDCYLGVEPDAGRVGFASRLYPGYTFQKFDHERLPTEDQSVDYVLIVAVLHHIEDRLILSYLKEFKRVLKPEGQILILEPYLCPETPVRNRLMMWYDDGQHMRDQAGYFQLFQPEYHCKLLNTFTKGWIYHELFFTAIPI
ncbi:class I SAM-dependent methyltransferase [Paenibacillus sp. CN-4]|uniref:class I SAM-dependent methyltransferase n=1 Tax=Paenibacillus nanchangensis TaxID=3348343 RepID=UPI0039790E6D